MTTATAEVSPEQTGVKTEPAKTCATCKHMGGLSWDNGSRQDHYCRKSDERRRDTMKPTGDFAQDFIDNFRTFFDASARSKACKYYEEAPPITAEEAEMLGRFDADGEAELAFFSNENSVASRHNEKFYQRDWYRNVDPGMCAYRLTDLGKVTRASVVKAVAK
jgi:hypothetical protein